MEDELHAPAMPVSVMRQKIAAAVFLRQKAAVMREWSPRVITLINRADAHVAAVAAAIASRPTSGKSGIDFRTVRPYWIAQVGHVRLVVWPSRHPAMVAAIETALQAPHDICLSIAGLVMSHLMGGQKNRLPTASTSAELKEA